MLLNTTSSLQDAFQVQICGQCTSAFPHNKAPQLGPLVSGLKPTQWAKQCVSCIYLSIPRWRNWDLTEMKFYVEVMAKSYPWNWGKAKCTIHKAVFERNRKSWNSLSEAYTLPASLMEEIQAQCEWMPWLTTLSNCHHVEYRQLQDIKQKHRIVEFWLKIHSPYPRFVRSIMALKGLILSASGITESGSGLGLIMRTMIIADHWRSPHLCHAT